MYDPYYRAFSTNYSTTYKFGNTSYIDNACFSSIFNSLTKHDKIAVFICTDDSILKQNKGNYCPLTLQEMKSWMNACKRVINFSYRFVQGTCDFSKSNRYYNRLKGISNGYWCNITFGKETTNVARRYVLTWLRYMYEGLYCPYVYLTYRLHELKGYCGIPLRKIFLNLLYVFNEWTTGHSFGIVKYSSNSTIQKRIKDSYIYRVNDVFETREPLKKYLKKPATFGDLYEYPLDKIVKACNNFKE